MSRAARLNPRGKPPGLVGQRRQPWSREVSFPCGSVAATSTESSPEESSHHQYYSGGREEHGSGEPGMHFGSAESLKRHCSWKGICDDPISQRSSDFGRLPGLCEWLSGETPTIHIYRLENLGVWMLPAGSAPQNPLELMQSGKLSPLMDQLEAWFDWIVIDSPPVLPLADTSLWSRLADGILLVTRKGTTEKQQLQRGLEAIEKSKLLGALVNSSANAAHSDYYQRYSSSSTDQTKE